MERGVDEWTDGYKELARDVRVSLVHALKEMSAANSWMHGLLSLVPFYQTSHGKLFFHMSLPPSFCPSLSPWFFPSSTSPPALPVTSRLIVLLTQAVVHFLFSERAGTSSFFLPLSQVFPRLCSFPKKQTSVLLIGGLVNLLLCHSSLPLLFPPFISTLSVQACAAQ